MFITAYFPLARMLIQRASCWLLLALLPIAGHTAEQVAALLDDVQTIKQQVLELNKDLFVLEEELLFPASTQVSIYISLDVGHYFKLDAVKLSVDGEMVSSYLYTKRQVDALRRGGIQRLYQGNIRNGAHEVVAIFTGFGPNGKDYRRATTLTFEKGAEAKQLELKIVDSTALQQPEFVVKEW